MQPRWMAFTICVSLKCICWSQDAACASAVLLPFELEWFHSEFMLPKPCSAVCPQCSSLPLTGFAVSLLWHPQCDPTQHYPVCFFFLTATHRKFSSEGGFVKTPLSLCVVSDLFPFCSSCHSSLLLSLSSLMNLICLPLLLEWRYFHSCYSIHSKGDSTILLLSFKSKSHVQNVFFLGFGLDDLQMFLPTLTILWFCVSTLLSHSFLCNLRWALNFLAQLWTLGFGENQHLCQLSLSQSHLF